MISADGKSITVATKNEHVQVWPREGNATGKRQRPAMDVMRAMGLDEIGEPAGAADAGDRRDFLMPHLAFFDELEIKRKHGEIAAARAPGGDIRGEFLFAQSFAVRRGQRWHRHGCEIATLGNFQFCIVHWAFFEVECSSRNTTAWGRWSASVRAASATSDLKCCAASSNESKAASWPM